jgi:probable HAF family extracellular repeat protein
VADDVALSLTNSGRICYWIRTPQGAIHAAAWSLGQQDDLGAPKGFLSSIARGINQHSQAVGWAVSTFNPVDSLATTQAVLFDKHGVRLLGTLGGRDSRALAINDKGQIVGVAQTAQGYPHAFVFDRHHMTDLGTLVGGTTSIACAINSRGHVAGAADTGRTFRHAVIWRDGHIEDLGTLPGGQVSYATTINDKDQVAGFAETPVGYHAFVWANGVIQDLGTLKEDPSRASGINNHGEVVGSSGAGHYTLHAFLWRDGALIDLNTRIDQKLGWVLTDAYAINDSGQIAACGRQADHINHALLLVPLAR